MNILFWYGSKNVELSKRFLWIASRIEFMVLLPTLLTSSTSVAMPHCWFFWSTGVSLTYNGSSTASRKLISSLLCGYSLYLSMHWTLSALKVKERILVLQKVITNLLFRAWVAHNCVLTMSILMSSRMCQIQETLQNLVHRSLKQLIVCELLRTNKPLILVKLWFASNKIWY